MRPERRNRTPPVQPMRILALDHGLARIGCAVCDPTGTVVRPLDPIEPADAGAAAAVVREQEAEAVVVGLPKTLAGREAEQAERARAFADELAAATAVPVESFDERFTTRMAESSRRAGAAAAEDSLAAAHMLESYLAASSGRERSGGRDA